MRITGKWLVCEDGITRPVVSACVYDLDQQVREELFLVDSGADHTVFSAEFRSRLRLIAVPNSPIAVQGLGGKIDTESFMTTVAFKADNGQELRVHGEYSAFLAREPSDISILGRDVLNNFHVVISKLRDEVLILSPQHEYTVS